MQDFIPILCTCTSIGDKWRQVMLQCRKHELEGGPFCVQVLAVKTMIIPLKTKLTPEIHMAINIPAVQVYSLKIDLKLTDDYDRRHQIDPHPSPHQDGSRCGNRFSESMSSQGFFGCKDHTQLLSFLSCKTTVSILFNKMLATSGKSHESLMIKIYLDNVKLVGRQLADSESIVSRHLSRCLDVRRAPFRDGRCWPLQSARSYRSYRSPSCIKWVYVFREF